MELKMKNLIGLQGCDTRIMTIARKKNEGPLKIKQFEQSLGEVETQVEQELQQLEACKKERREVEREIEELEHRIEKSNVKLSTIKSNKEYRAALKEISDVGKEKTSREDRAIELMEEIELLEEKCAAGREKMKQVKEQFEADREKVLTELTALEQDLEALQEERARFCRNIDEELLKRYDHLRKHKQGVAITPVLKGVCQACHLGIPPQKFNELLKGSQLMSCPNCKRIIYWGDDERLKA